MISAFDFVCSDAMIFLRNLVTLNAPLVLVPIVLFVLMVAKWYLEHRIGTTPGKWMLRIRTVGRNLRSPTATQLVLRDLLLWCDVPLLITPLPAAISMMMSRCRQRLGDRLAGTIVIDC